MKLLLPAVALGITLSILAATAAPARNTVLGTPGMRAAWGGSPNPGIPADPAPDTRHPSPDPLPDIIRLFSTDRSSVQRFHDLPWSEARFDRLEAFYRLWQDRLAQLDFDALDQHARIDYLLLRNELDSSLAHLALDRDRLAEMDPLLPFRLSIQTLEQARRRMDPVDPEAAAATLATIPEQIKTLRKRIEKADPMDDTIGSRTDSPIAEPNSDSPQGWTPIAGGEARPSEGRPSATPGHAIPNDPDPTGVVRETSDRDVPQPAIGPDNDRSDSGRLTHRPDLAPDSTTPTDTVPPLPVSPVLARRAAAAVNDLRGTLAEWYTFYEGFEPEFSWWVRAPYTDAAKALDDLAKHLREDIAGMKGEDTDPLIGDPIGAEALAADLAAEMIPYTPEELIAIAEREFAWCEDQMRRAAADMGFHDDDGAGGVGGWTAALAEVKAAHVPPGRQDDLVTEQARHAIRFVKDRDLVTIPPLCEETWRLRMISPEGQKTLPFAVYYGQAMGVAYAAEGMAHDAKLMSMRGNNRHFSRIVTPHELIPGHHLQGFMAARIRPERSIFSTPFFVEGWAVYWEMRLWELGYPESPEDRIGMLFWRMHRCARIIVSLRFHLGLMSPEEMIDFLVQRVGHERSGATSEVRRYIGGDYGPLYQAGYMLGALQLRALHRELVEAGAGGGMTDKQFNDALLTFGSIPVELIRAGLTDTPLSRDTRALWRFADAP